VRWSDKTVDLFGRSILVEANAGYDVGSTQWHVGILSADTTELVKLRGSGDYACFSPSGWAKLDAYYGKNSILRISGTNADPKTLFTEIPAGTNMTRFSLPIFSLAGMKETTRLPSPSIENCISPTYQYTLLDPHTYEYKITNSSGPNPWEEYLCNWAYPDEWSTSGRICNKQKLTDSPRFTCLTEHTYWPSGLSLSDAEGSYTSTPCLYGTISIDGRYYDGSSILAPSPAYFWAQCLSPGDPEAGTPGTDTTIYRNYVYHTIPSTLRHISPTITELAFAEANGATPSLPIDVIRSVEFLTERWNRAEIIYPNFFEAPLTSITDVRTWLRDISNTAWNKIISEESSRSMSPIDSIISRDLRVSPIPPTPLDWNTLISDDVIEKVIQSRRWLSPQVTEKYKSLVETTLSYSHTSSGDTLSMPPKLPDLSSGYDIAYLGLAPFVPGWEKNPNSEEFQAYQYRLGELQGLNFTEHDPALDDPASRDTALCGPPDWVPLFQWPSAMMCWVKTLLPVRISAGSCGGNTIWLSNLPHPLAVIPSAIIRDSTKLREYYSEWNLVYTLARTSLTRESTLPISYRLDRDGSTVIPSLASEFRLEIVSIVASGGNIVPSDFSQYASLVSSPSLYGERGSEFLFSSSDRLATITLKPTIIITLPDSTKLEIVWDPLKIKITDEYLDVMPIVWGRATANIETTETLPVDIVLTPKKWNIDSILPEALPYKIDIYDDLTDTIIESGIVWATSSYRFPDWYKNTIGSYRIIATDREGRTWETILTVRSGPVSRMEFFPVSSTLVKWSQSLWVLRLLDARGNPISPTLLSLKATIVGWYLLDESGTQKTSISLDTIDSEFTFSYGTLDTRDIRLTFDIADPSITTSIDIAVIEKPRIKIIRSAMPMVWGNPIDMQIEIVDALTDAPLTGFSSLAFLDISAGAWIFSGSELRIIDGRSEPFLFTPGKKAGEHLLSIEIPGVSNIPAKKFNILPGKVMYIDSNVTDTTVEFVLRDRYGNIATEDALSGALTKNQDPPFAISFVDGIVSLPRSSGYWRVDVPSIEDNTLTYADSESIQTSTGVTTVEKEKTIRGIWFYNLYVQDKVGKFNFLPDYSARYTVLAWDSYLEEGAQILYDTTSWSSSSLAVSTLLMTPYTQDTLFSVFPGGWWSLWEPSDMAIATVLSPRWAYLSLEVRDSASETYIADISYPLIGLPLSVCTESGTETHLCGSSPSEWGITFALFPESEYRVEKWWSSMSIIEDTTPLISYTSDRWLFLTPGISLIPRAEYSYGWLVADIEESGKVIGRLYIRLPETQGVDVAPTNIPVTRLTLSSTHSYLRKDVYSDSFVPESRGYSIYRNSPSITLDERIIWPGQIGSFGSLRESPWVGWQGNNRTLLSFAAWDSVGESTRWFHDYTLVNLGDPVAHVDQWAPGTELEGIDRSIGTQVADSSERSIASYKVRDMNADGLDDIVVVYNDGFIELYMNLGGVFRKKQKIAYIPDISSRWVEFWDFTGDKYADIVSLDHSGSLVLIDNDKRKLTERLISLESGDIPKKITQYKIYDMDRDNLDDIVYLTEGGKLGILYGTASVWVFTESILDTNLGISLSWDPERAWWALRADSIPKSLLSNTLSGNSLPDTWVLNAEVFYQRRVNSERQDPNISKDTMAIWGRSIEVDPSSTDQILSSYFWEPNSTNSPLPSDSIGSPARDIYIRSEYAPAYGVEIEKKYKNITATTLHGWDRIRVEITIRNTTPATLKNIEYLDTLAKIFDLPTDAKYSITLAWASRDYPLTTISAEEYDFSLRGVDIPAGQTLIFSYELEALPTSYGNMIVDRLEGWLVGDDLYGDVGFETSNTCGADMILWSSTDTRRYVRGTRSFTQAELPPSLAGRLQDADKNGIPDSVENMSTWALNDAYKTMGNQTSMSERPLVNTNIDKNRGVISIWLSPEAEAQAETVIKNLADSLACGFGWWGCLSMPINWAPLAPGNAISVLGTPVGKSPNVNQWLPIFSALTKFGIWPIYGVCYGIPMVWPVSPLSYSNWWNCFSDTAQAWWSVPSQIWSILVGWSSAPSYMWAGWVLGTQSSSNFLRIFVTPTLTLGMGGAVCMGGPASSNPNPLFPLVSKWNCIVMTKSLPVCKWDGSWADGDVSGISGLGSTTEAWSASSCKMKAATSLSSTENTKMTEDIIAYLKNPETTRLNAIYSSISKRGWRGIDLGWPVARIGDGVTSGTTIDIGLDTSKPLSADNIVKVNNRRISWFPEFIMDWVSRQTDELTTKFLTLPNIVIIPPRSFGQNAVVDGSYSDFLARFSKDSLEKWYADLKKQVGDTGQNTNVTDKFTKNTKSKNEIGQKYDAWLDKTVKENASTINTLAGWANQVKAVYQFLGQLPLLRVERTVVPINIPWPLPQEFDRFERTLTQWKSEIQNTEQEWCKWKTSKECADLKTTSGLSGLSSGIGSNLRRIQEWKKLPDKIQKYITWKQRYMTQLLCNVGALEEMIGWWYRDNGMRFKKWAEFYVLMKTIVATWQPFIDIWREKDRSCSVCQNQRWDLKYFRFKALSAVIPSFPILQFPRWPDIVLDLSDIRLGILVSVPEFQFNISPIRLPDLPTLGLPGLPSLSVNFPNLPLLIPPVPNLPDLPDMPSIPQINLPNLPSPPKLPKLFGAVSAALNIFKLYTRIQCYMEKTVLIPEDYVGATIAQRTDRQGTLPFDFLSVETPQIALSSKVPREIRVSTHVNFELKSDFITEFARNAVKPLNRLNADFSQIPQKILPDINISAPPGINLPPPPIIPPGIPPIKPLGLKLILPDTLSQKQWGISDELTSLSSSEDEMMDIDIFTPYLRRELVLAWLDARELDKSLILSDRESDKLTREMQRNTQEGLNLLREYIQSEEAQTHEVEKMLDRMRQPSVLLSSIDTSLAQYISSPSDQSAWALMRYDTWQSRSQDSLTEKLQWPVREERKIHSLQGQIRRLVAVEGSLESSSSSSTAPWYSPVYEGIFILTPDSKTQTRLFDYTDLLSQEDPPPSVIDIDKDGDSDYIFLMGWSIYVKYSHTSEPDRPIDDTSPAIISADLSLSPRAPDFFHEIVASPGHMELSFVPADSSDRSFRLEFFDRYLEWDYTTLSGNDDPDTPRTVIDMTTSPVPTVASDFITSPIRRSLEDVSSPDGFILEGMKVSTLLPGQQFSLSAGRALYTGNSSASLEYMSPVDDSMKTLSLERFEQYTFPISLSWSIKSGKLYVLTPSGWEKLPYSDDMRGMPLLPNIRIYHPNGSVVIYDPLSQKSDAILPNTEYRHLDLGKIATEYSIDFPFADGFYSARLRSLRDDRMIRAGVTLIAPQASLDRSSPVVDTSSLRIPVYSPYSIVKKDIITEWSIYSVMIDPDVTIDTDNNGIYDDDYVMSASGLIIGASDIVLGPYDTLGKRLMSMRVVDMYGNVATEPFEVEVYPPVPKIESANLIWMLTGSLSEEIPIEPIHLFRLREGDAMKLIDPIPYLTDISGAFSGARIDRSTGITLEYLLWSASLSEKTGLPYNAANIGAEFFPATSTGAMQIRFTDNRGDLLFRYEILPPPDIQIVTTLAGDTGDAALLLVSSSSWNTLISASLSDPSIPGWVYMLWTDSKPLIAIDRYGQIYSLDKSLIFTPKEKDGYIQITILRSWVIQWALLYRVNFFISWK
jgi:hypothetical protein